MNDLQAILHDSSSDDEDYVGLIHAVHAVASVAAEASHKMSTNRKAMAIARLKKTDKRSIPRKNKPRKKLDHSGALFCIVRDFLGPEALFLDDFDLYFRISRSRFDKIFNDIGRAGIKFFTQPKTNLVGAPIASMEARILLPLKTLAYGVAMHCFCPYFQISKSLAIDCCREFDKAICFLYLDEWLRCPTADDLTNIVNLHHHQHGVPGMLGSLDCSQIFWKNCPKAWHGTYKTGKEKKPSVILEAICDYNCFFWHATFGYAGSLSDNNVLSLSPFLSKLLDGSFSDLEAHLIPFSIAGEEFDQCYVLTDGVYPLYARFAKPVKQPLTMIERRYTKWQESVRKAIERAFGILKERWQWVDRPIQLRDVQEISLRMNTCLILHNICVSDRVMGDVTASYKPDYDLTNLRPHERLDLAQDAEQFQAFVPRGDPPIVGNTNMTEEAMEWILSRDMNWNRLVNEDEYYRLFHALQNYFNAGHDDGFEAIPPREFE